MPLQELPPSDSDPGVMSRRTVLQLPFQLAGGLSLAAFLESCASGQNMQPGEPLTPHVTMEATELHEATDLAQAGSWHQAGVKATSQGLDVSPTGLSIVNKRENGRIDPDPPLNIYGTRLQVTGDFSVSTHIESDAPVALQLYGAVPLRFDDFRYESARLECVNNGNTLTVRVWDGSSQEPALAQTFSFNGSPLNRLLEVQRIGNDLQFTMNGKPVGNLQAGHIFNRGEVWFGLNSEVDRAYVHNLTVTPLHGHRIAAVDTTSLRLLRPLPDGGMQHAPGKQNLRLGSAVALNPLVSAPSYAELFLGGEIGSVTTENALKPQDVQPTEGIFTFDEADAIVTIASQNGLVVHGHTLVYDKAMPKWMQDLPFSTPAEKQRVRDVLEAHIKSVVGHFKGRIKSWDVVNEAISGFNDGVQLEDNLWYKALGEEYIDIAFHAAHEADPDAELYINDYGMETNPQGRGQYMHNLIQRLQARGVPIHGVGIQGHVYEIPRDTIHTQTLQRLMSTFNNLGLKTRVSELDVTGANGPDVQAQQYRDVLQVCRQAPNCSGLTFWGLDDGHGSTAGLVGNKLQAGNALPYTTDYRPKYARALMESTLHQ